MSESSYLYFTISKPDGVWLVVWSSSTQEEVCQAYVGSAADASSVEKLAATSLKLSHLSGSLTLVEDWQSDPRLVDWRQESFGSNPTPSAPRDEGPTPLQGGLCRGCPAASVCTVYKAIANCEPNIIEVSTCQVRQKLQ